MIHLKKRIFSIMFMMLAAFGMIFSTIGDEGRTTISVAHSGRTDSSGGHRDNKNKSGLGYYHYHCGGHPAHLHKNGVCPYSSTSKSSSSSISKSDIKKVQQKLNKLGYSCGTPDGVCGKKTREAVKKYQKANGLTVNGKITKSLLKHMKIK